MLSSNSILRQGRYRIIQKLAGDGTSHTYDAHDNLLGQTVIIHETAITSEALFSEHVAALKKIDHDGVVAIRDHFTENGCGYIATEPVLGHGVWQLRNNQRNEADIAAVFARLKPMLAALGRLRSMFTTDGHTEITPAHIRSTTDDKLKLVFFGLNEERTAASSESHYCPLELVWDGLDLASQKAISHKYDDSDLETLESPPDFRSDIYSLGATFYELLTGRSPMSSLERSIELLDAKSDPLAAPAQIESLVPVAYSNFIVKAMELRREDRFAKVETAMLALPAVMLVPKGPVARVEIATDDFEDLDLLELPTHTSVPPKSVVPNGGKGVPIAPTTVGVVETNGRRAMVSEQSPADVGKAASLFTTAEQSFADLDVKSKPVRFDAKPQSVTNELQTSVETGLAPLEKRGVGMMAIAAAAIVVLIAAVWGIISMTSSTKPGQPTKVDGPAASMSDISNSASQPSVTLEVDASSSANVANSTLSSSTPTDTQLPDDQMPQTKIRPQVAEAKPLKTPEVKGAQKPTPKPKKSVTVEDLIGDN